MPRLRKLPQEKRSSAVLAGTAAAEAATAAETAAANGNGGNAANDLTSVNSTNGAANDLTSVNSTNGTAAAGAAPGIDGTLAAARPETTADAHAAAFFDCDNTIVQGAAIFYLGRGLYKRKFFSKRELLRFAWQQTYFRLHGAEHAGHMADAKESALSIVQGHRVEDLERICEEIFEEYIAEKIWPGTRALVKMHLEAGQRVWLVTAAPLEAARVIAARLGMTGALGTVAEAIGGIYTGRLVGETLHGPAKAEAVRALAAREDLDLALCAAYSDSSNDIPMLSLVGYPYVINPDSELRRHAREQGWRVRDFRTGRKAARVGIPAAAGIGAAAGGTAAALALYRNRHRNRPG